MATPQNQQWKHQLDYIHYYSVNHKLSYPTIDTPHLDDRRVYTFWRNSSKVSGPNTTRALYFLYPKSTVSALRYRMNFRTDIQLMRGVAVLLVVLFHFGIDSIHSGFLGVDVFFVLSGFLMAVIYDRSQKAIFLLGRAKRLLPAYFVTVLATLTAAYFVTTPNEFNQVVKQSNFAALFSSNIGYWLQNSYFSKVEFNPLLHLWSLGVEIQFYLIVPILAIMIHKYKVLIAIIGICSLILCFKVLQISPKTSFFMMPLRLWEFLLGYGAALYFTANGAIRYRNKTALGLISLFIVLCIPLMSVSGELSSILYGHPGVHALVVSIATANVLIFGLPKFIESSKIGSILVVFGNYSYSIYLVHFPVIVLYLSSPFSGTVLEIPTAKDAVFLLLLITTTTLLLHHLIEKRMRSVSFLKLVMAPIVLTIGLAMIFQQLQFKSLSPDERYVFNAFSDRSNYRCGKVMRILNPGSTYCEITPNVNPALNRLMLVGNSHADSIKTAFARVAVNNNTSVLFAVPNNPLMNGGLSPEQLVKDAVSKNVTTLVLHYSTSRVKEIPIERTISLASEYKINVAFIEPTATWDEHIPQAMYNNLKNEKKLPEQTVEEYENRNSDSLELIRSVRHQNFKAYSIADYLCQPKCLLKSPEAVPYYFDTGHLTLTGSNVLRPLFAEIIKDSIGG